MSINKGCLVGIHFMKECKFAFSLPRVKSVPTDFFHRELA